MAALALYVLGPQPHVEWRDPSPQQGVRTAATTWRNYGVDYEPARPGHRHIALSLGSVKVRLFDLDFTSCRFLGFGVGDDRGASFPGENCASR